jgi:S-adenosylmethionine hydrolase
LSIATGVNSPTRVINLSKSNYRLQPTSSTFHGRDIFAPTAAYLSLGVPPQALGETVDAFARLSIPTVLRTEGTLDGEIIYIDAFGNLFTNIRADDLTKLTRQPIRIILGDLSIPGLALSYAAVKPGNYVALINSWGLLEIAVCQASAQKRCGATIGDKVQIRSAY